jgi:hypothetical protein
MRSFAFPFLVSSSQPRIVSFSVLCSFLFVTWTLPSVSAQSIEWTEKDLAKNVHRAEEAFEAGEMSRSYGLFAHLVSIAGDRAFLHFRFGSICTYTAGHLEAAEEHLRWAEDLGVLESEHAAEWNYYQGRVDHLRYKFDEAELHYRSAIDLGKTNESWMNDAKLFYGQCVTERTLGTEVMRIATRSKLVSHSDDFFRLIDMPIEDGRILKTPDALRSKYDFQLGYTSTMHWIPEHRFAFYASYGKKGNTGLDIYRVSVDGMGEYGEPERLPFPINTDFDDCAPICIAGADDPMVAGQLYYSSSRPESYGGYDVFQSSGRFLDASFDFTDEFEAQHLPLEINSTSDEWLFYASPKNDSRWLVTNRQQDFEGKEIWEFGSQTENVIPMAIRLEIQETVPTGKLVVTKEGAQVGLLTFESGNATSEDFLVESGIDLDFTWKDENGVTLWTEPLSIPNSSSSKISMEALVVGLSNDGLVSVLSRPSTFVDESTLAWTAVAMDMNQRKGAWLEPVNSAMAEKLRRENREPADIQRILLAQESEVTGEATTGIKAIPNWVLKALDEVEDIDVENHPLTVSNIRSKALRLQNTMEVVQCWDAPGTNSWKLEVAIKRYGEPALVVLSEETRGLERTSEQNVNQWKEWLNHVSIHIAGKENVSQDWLMLSDYLRAQVKANESALVQIQDMHRRVEAHLVYDRWVTEALPMALPEFRNHLLQLTSQNQDLHKSVLQAAACGAKTKDLLSQKWVDVQELLWVELSEGIVEVQELGVFDLPSMEDAQSWFIRSGGLLEDAKKANSPQEQLERGQAAVGLAWETFNKGASKRDIVARETQMTDSEWWSNFGSTSNDADKNYGDFDVFSSNNAPFVQQAALYLEELDIIRTKTPKTESYKASMSNAIALRSNLEYQLQTLFGGTTVRDTPSSKPNIQQVRTVRDVPLAVDEEKEGNLGRVQELEQQAKSWNPPVYPETKTKTETAVSDPATERFQYTVQIGAFSNLPDNDVRWYARSTRIKSGKGITRCFVGTFDEPSQATKLLEAIRSDIPDAFISKVSRDISIPAVEFKNSNDTRSSSKEQLNSSSPTTQYFRLKICTLTTPLNSSNKARLMRLGNDIPLTMTQNENSTVYFSKTYANFADAEQALTFCKRKGFADVELQIID